MMLRTTERGRALVARLTELDEHKNFDFLGALSEAEQEELRRMLRKIAGNVYDDLGDTTALAKPEVLDHIIVGHRNLLRGQHETANLPDEDQPKE